MQQQLHLHEIIKKQIQMFEIGNKFNSTMIDIEEKHG